ncbi:hypothetical protein ACOT7R_09070 [Clostridium perfringens]|nr:hypothetical protein [Clostridium perfringens]KQC91332.1 hypothetical protein AM596_14945 [Clostridium perfringens CP4]
MEYKAICVKGTREKILLTKNKIYDIKIQDDDLKWCFVICNDGVERGFLQNRFKIVGENNEY